MIHMCVLSFDTGYMSGSPVCSQLHLGTLPGLSLVPTFYWGVCLFEMHCHRLFSWGGIAMDLVSSPPPASITLQAFCFQDLVAGIGYYRYVAGLDALGPTDFSDPIWASAPL